MAGTVLRQDRNDARKRNVCMARVYMELADCTTSFDFLRSFCGTKGVALYGAGSELATLGG